MAPVTLAALKQQVDDMAKRLENLDKPDGMLGRINVTLNEIKLSLARQHDPESCTRASNLAFRIENLEQRFQFRLSAVLIVGIGVWTVLSALLIAWFKTHFHLS